MVKELQGIGMTSQRTRQRMVERLFAQGIRNPLVLDVMAALPRHIFLDEALAHRAYEDTALPIGFNQTLSQPYIVARMTELLLESGKPENVLEIGTGSGYQTAVLAKVATKVFSVERIKALQDKARERLRRLHIYNTTLRCTDGGFGWADKGPFDAIMATAAPTQVPGELLDQLSIGGRLVIPVGAAGAQHLHLITRREEDFENQVVEAVSFVPLLSGIVR